MANVKPGDNTNLAQAGISQYSAIVTQIMKQASGNANLATVDANNFATVAHLVTTGQSQPMDAIMAAISQVLSYTIFVNRPYRSKLLGLDRTDYRYGGFVRKITEAETDDIKDDLGYELKSGNSVDMYTINLPQMLEFRFDEMHPLQAYRTFLEDQVQQAFTGYDEFARFVGLMMQYMANMLEFKSESLRRMLISSFVAAKIAADQPNVVKLITQYNAELGLNATGKTPLTKQDIMSPEYFAPFFRWAAGRILSYSQWMSERSDLFHMQVNAGRITRFTPPELQRMYILNSNYNNIVTQVLSTTFHDAMATIPYNELVTYWQDIKSPSSIDIVPKYIDADGQTTSPVDTSGNPVATQNDNVFAVLVDRDTLGYSIQNRSQRVTPPNGMGRYYNVIWNETARWWMDLTENGIVFLLE